MRVAFAVLAFSYLSVCLPTLGRFSSLRLLQGQGQRIMKPVAPYATSVRRQTCPIPAAAATTKPVKKSDCVDAADKGGIKYRELFVSLETALTQENNRGGMNRVRAKMTWPPVIEKEMEMRHVVLTLENTALLPAARGTLVLVTGTKHGSYAYPVPNVDELIIDKQDLKIDVFMPLQIQMQGRFTVCLEQILPGSATGRLELACVQGYFPSL